VSPAVRLPTLPSQTPTPHLFPLHSSKSTSITHKLIISVDLHTGTPRGTTQTLHGLETYISTPSSPTQGKQDTLIFLPDIFGVYTNAKLLVDEWAGKGYRCLMPDVFEGDAVPEAELNVSAARFYEMS
jgi:hypothetical protein